LCIIEKERKKHYENKDKRFKLHLITGVFVVKGPVTRGDGLEVVEEVDDDLAQGQHHLQLDAVLVQVDHVRVVTPEKIETKTWFSCSKTLFSM
jgi:hypothetical protein